MTNRIPVAGPWITEKEIAYVTDAVTTNWYQRAGEYVGRFEDAFRVATNRRYAVSLPSCTAGLHLALAALDVGPGDEVIVPDLTWIATSAPINYVGATPVFVDVDPATWCLSPSSLRAAITDRTRAVIVVDLYGGMADYDEILKVARRRSIPVIEDAAEAIGSEMGGRPAGSFGVASAFSFHGSKTLTTGEGGMLVTDDEQFVRRVRTLRDHGRLPADRTFVNAEVAFKYKMSSMQAALGLGQLERLGELIARKREIFGWYQIRLSTSVQLNAQPVGTLNSYWMITAVVPEDCRVRTPELMRGLEEFGIDTRPMFHPLSSLPAYSGLASARGARERNPVSYSVSPRGINLPSALSLTETDVERVSTALLELIDR
ncbi:MAG: DegT/DnrJ/EryC1/StrS family aminotransferase [Acidimicrobiales bacterium]